MLKCLPLSSESKRNGEHGSSEKRPFHPTAAQRYTARFNRAQDTLYNEYSMKRPCASSFPALIIALVHATTWKECSVVRPCSSRGHHTAYCQRPSATHFFLSWNVWLAKSSSVVTGSAYGPACEQSDEYNGTKASIETLIAAFNAAPELKTDRDIVIAPTALHLGLAQSLLRKEIQVAAQNIWKVNVGSVVPC